MKKEQTKISKFKTLAVSKKGTFLINGGSGTVTVLDTDMESAHVSGMTHDLEGFTKS